MPRDSHLKRRWQEHRDEMLAVIERAVRANHPKMSARSKKHWREHREAHLPNAMRAIAAARRALKAENFASLRGVRKSGQTGMGPQNIHADEYHLIAPDGAEYHGVNIAEFVRAHSDLFATADTQWEDSMCKATRGLCALRPWLRRPARGWKGWRWVS